MVIRDTNQNRFGAFLSESLKVADKCFGSGETFIFQLLDDETPQVFKWSGDCNQNLFILCSLDSFCIGIADGKFAICLDATLNQGRSQSCTTFNSKPLTPQEDFVAAVVEIWTFK
jgi:hypothetical protein